MKAIEGARLADFPNLLRHVAEWAGSRRDLLDVRVRVVKLSPNGRYMVVVNVTAALEGERFSFVLRLDPLFANGSGRFVRGQLGRQIMEQARVLRAARARGGSNGKPR